MRAHECRADGEFPRPVGASFLALGPRRQWVQGDREVEEMGATEVGNNSGVVAPVTFIVRTWQDAGGRLTGVVERVATGEKVRFQGAEALAQLIQRMLERPKAPPAGNVTDE